MVKKALYGMGIVYMGLSLAACAPERRMQVVYGDQRTVLNVPIKMYEIQEGDTFDLIAKSNGITQNALHEINPKLENRNHIEVGAILYIPLENRVITKVDDSHQRLLK
jgi:hypothetical protein